MTNAARSSTSLRPRAGFALPGNACATGLAAGAFLALALLPARNCAGGEPAPGPAAIEVAGVYGVDATASANAALEDLARRAGMTVAQVPKAQVDAIRKGMRDQVRLVDLMAFLDASGSYEVIVADVVAKAGAAAAFPSQGRWTISAGSVLLIEDAGVTAAAPRRFAATWKDGLLVVPALPGALIPLFLRRTLPSLAGEWRLDPKLTVDRSTKRGLAIVEQVRDNARRLDRLRRRWPQVELDLDVDGGMRLRTRQARIEIVDDADPDPFFGEPESEPSAVPEAERRYEGLDLTVRNRGSWRRQGRELWTESRFVNGAEARSPAKGPTFRAEWAQGEPAEVILTIPNDGETGLLCLRRSPPASPDAPRDR
jgi:hypothetical protein